MLKTLRLLTLALCWLFFMQVSPIRAQVNVSDAALQAAIDAANRAIPNLGRPNRWFFELLLPTQDTALSCPLVTGVQGTDSKTPVIITLEYADGLTYAVHAASDGSRAVPCDPKFPNMGIQPPDGTPQAATACILTPSAGFANVRSRPEVDAPQVATLESARPALGRDRDWTWYLVQEGWVAGTVVTASGNCLSNDLSIRSSEIAAVLAPTVDAQGTPLAPTPQNTVCPPSFTGYLPPRLQIGSANAQVEIGGLPNTLRAQPTTNSERLGTIQPSRRIDRVISGPQCSEGYVWWQVEIDGTIGWTAESGSAENEYFLVPLDVNGQPIVPTPASADLGAWQSPSQIALDAGIVRWSPLNPDLLAVTSANTLYLEPSPLTATPNAPFAVLPEDITALAFSPDGQQIALGTQAGGVYLYGVNTRAALALLPDAHTNDAGAAAPINALTFSPDGVRLVSGSGADGADAGYLLRVWNTDALRAANNAESLLRNMRYPVPVRALHFSTTGEHLAVVGAATDGTSGGFWVYEGGGLGANTLVSSIQRSGGLLAPLMATTETRFAYTDGASLLLQPLSPPEPTRIPLFERTLPPDLRYTDGTLLPDAGALMLLTNSTQDPTLNGVWLLPYTPADPTTQFGSAIQVHAGAAQSARLNATRTQLAVVDEAGVLWLYVAR